jgi:predicted small metal-binding protein
MVKDEAEALKNVVDAMKEKHNENAKIVNDEIDSIAEVL